MNGVLALLLVIFGLTIGVVAVVFLAVPVFKGIAWFITAVARSVVWVFRHVGSFIVGMIGDAVRALGGVITAFVLVPLILANVVIGRWSAAGHYGRALQDEAAGVGHALYRFVIGHPARFLLLHGLTEGIEKRIPQAVKHAPGPDRPGGKTGQFDGYTVVGSLPGGGSGGRLYVAEPDERKRAAFERAGHRVDQVVIKSFSLADGASLTQITRENRALEAAQKLGLILDHDLSDSRFFYVMEFIPGDSLTVVTRRLHAEAGSAGLGQKQLRAVLAMIADLLTELERYHAGGLWHKDVKPDNIIINQGRARLVDLGLITPLRSAMTLTTHGTEYFRDPELVRMALRKAKVHEVDGVKFDLYGVGAVLYAVVENSFPAHGALSQITKSCPEALRWVVRRAMADLSNRYPSARAMRADLAVLLSADDPFMVRPADLPSVRGGDIPADAHGEPVHEREPAFARFPAAAAAAPGPSPVAAGPAPADAPPRRRAAPYIGVVDWFTGRYSGYGDGAGYGSPRDHGAARLAHDAAAVAAAGLRSAGQAIENAFGAGGRAGARYTPPMPRGPGRTAAEQLQAAQERIRRAQERIARRSPAASNTSFRNGRFSSEPNLGVGAAFFVFLAATVITAFLVISYASSRKDGAQPAPALGRYDILTPGQTITLALDAPGAGGAPNDPSRIDILSSIRSGVIADDKGRPVRLTDEQLEQLNRAAEAAARTTDRMKEKLGIGAARPDAIPAPPPPPAPAPGSGPVQPAQGAPHGSVLLLNMLPADAGESEQPLLSHVAARLAGAGYIVRGIGAAPGDTDLLAAARRTIELASPEDAEAVQRVQAWIDAPATEVDAILWIGEGADPGAVVRRLIVRGGADAAPFRRAISGASR